MDWVSAKIMLGGDSGSVVHRGKFNPVSWPEVAVLQFLHGEESVFDCEYVKSEPASARVEKDRLIGIYGVEPVELIFPGRNPSMDGTFPGDKTPEAKPVEPRKPVPERRGKAAPSAEV